MHIRLGSCSPDPGLQTWRTRCSSSTPWPAVSWTFSSESFDLADVDLPVVGTHDRPLLGRSVGPMTTRSRSSSAMYHVGLRHCTVAFADLDPHDGFAVQRQLLRFLQPGGGAGAGTARRHAVASVALVVASSRSASSWVMRARSSRGLGTGRFACRGRNTRTVGRAAWRFSSSASATSSP